METMDELTNRTILQFASLKNNSWDQLINYEDQQSYERTFTYLPMLQVWRRQQQYTYSEKECQQATIFSLCQIPYCTHQINDHTAIRTTYYFHWSTSMTICTKSIRLSRHRGLIPNMRRIG
ncbi:unnamed protein product [Dracunculus medinensis]|uniref:Ovule protein n=1 Tax=Dracunculus medinensis TaxID=318479 RepID=A0A0N4UN23_DRAME|nr:unnamed protein product [Dracunculus medinensis]